MPWAQDFPVLIWASRLSLEKTNGGKNYEKEALMSYNGNAPSQETGGILNGGAKK
jgi:hypothetical protein